MKNRLKLTAAAVLMIAGCSSPATPIADPSENIEAPSEPQSVTFYVAGMNQRLKIL